MIQKFFSPQDFDKFPPCGMFNIKHLIAIIVCTIMIILCLNYSLKNFDDFKVKKLTRIFAIIVAGLELIKITYNFYYGYTNVDAWVPLAYCSLFIYSLFFAGYGSGLIEKLGRAFLVGGAIVGGTAFLISPSTSLMLHPLFHFLSFHSLFFHSAMIYFSLLYLIKGLFIPSIDNYKYYLLFFYPFMLIALIINLIFHSNLMFLREPFNFPIKFIVDLYNKAHITFPLIVGFSYSALYVIPFGIYSLFLKKRMYNYADIIK